MGAATNEEIVNLAMMKIGQKDITSLTDTGDNTAVKANNVFAFLRRKLLREHPWNFASFSAILGHVTDGTAKTITGATKTNPVVITATAHGFSNDDIISIITVVGMVELNGKKFTVANKTDDTFELSGIDGTSFSTYVSGGTAGVVSVVGAEVDYDNRYNLPSDYLKIIKVIGDPMVFDPVRPIPSRVRLRGAGILYSIESGGTNKELLTDETEAAIKYIANLTDPVKFDDTFVETFALLLAAQLAYTITQSRSIASEARDAYVIGLATAKGLNAQEGGTPATMRQDDVLDSRA